MKRFVHLILATVLSFASAFASGAENLPMKGGWVLLSATPGDAIKLYLKPETIRFTENRANSKIVLVTSALVQDGAINYSGRYVRVNECKAGFGTLFTVNFAGEVEYSNDFVIDGQNTVADTIAAVLCSYVNTPSQSSGKPAKKPVKSVKSSDV